MIWLVLIGIVIVIAIIIGIAQSTRPKSDAGSFPFEKNKALFSPAERSFLGVLEQTVGQEYKIFGKIRLADIVSVRKGISPKENRGAFNKISSKHLDFILCNPTDLSVVCGIELDDKSHNSGKSQKRDELIKNVFEAVSIPLVRVKAQATYNPNEIQQQIFRALGRVPAVEIVSPPPPISEATIPTTETPEKSCPKCSAPMKRRKATRGAHAGKDFWGCSSYPKCKTAFVIES
jgi:hypothetical protein